MELEMFITADLDKSHVISKDTFNSDRPGTMHPLSKAERLHVGCKITVGQGADSDRTKATSDGGYLHHQLQKKYDQSRNSQRPSEFDITKTLSRSACLYPLCSVSLEFLSCL